MQHVMVYDSNTRCLQEQGSWLKHIRRPLDNLITFLYFYVCKMEEICHSQSMIKLRSGQLCRIYWPLFMLLLIATQSPHNLPS